jgi:DNA uptake protein ComE-like DNA-binding protein
MSSVKFDDVGPMGGLRPHAFDPRQMQRFCGVAPVHRALSIIPICVLALACRANENSQNSIDVNAVCTRCHTADVFMTTPRSWSRWNEVFRRMLEHGATGTDEQYAGITEFFLSNLTIINVNTSPPDELEWVLNASPSVRDLILERRTTRRFTSLADLSSVPGIDRDRIHQLKERILF